MPRSCVLEQLLATVVAATLPLTGFPPPGPAVQAITPVRTTVEFSPTAFGRAGIRNSAKASAVLNGGTDSHVAKDAVKKSKREFRLLAANKPVTPASVEIQQNRGLTFVENKGQFDQRAKFRASNGEKTLWLTENG